MQICRVCKVEKPLAAFAADKYRPNGKCSRCRSCRRNHYRENHSSHLGQMREYQNKNRAKMRERQLEYYHKNKEERSAYMSVWYLRNKEKVAENVKRYREENPGFGAWKTAMRRATARRATPSWANLDKIAEIYETAAWLTKESGEEFHVDHIVPLQGKTVCGLHCEANLTLLPAGENISKSNRYWPDMW